MKITPDRIADTTIEQARRVNVVSLSERYSKLSKLTNGEWAGPCPKCGGDDRFHVKEDGWFCRQCKPIDPKHGWHDSIDFMQWLQSGLSFAEAVAQLTNGSLPEAVQRQPEQKQRESHLLDQNEWARGTEIILKRAQKCLLGPDGKPGQDYLTNRGFEPRVWLQFGLGYNPNTAIPGTEGKERAPAIAMPWYAGGKLTGVRYRFLTTHNGRKQTSEAGSQFVGRLFGSQGLPDWATMASGRCGTINRNDSKFQFADLVICEGEFNAMSLWQSAGHTNLHTLSLGSESAKLTDAMIAAAQRYRNIIIWADRTEVARELQAAMPRANSIVSPGGKDANDLLQQGLLGAVIGVARLRACRDEYEQSDLLYDLNLAEVSLWGVDAGTKQLIQKMAGELGRLASYA